jgi:DNA-binding XRE family transcriptional regulator
MSGPIHKLKSVQLTDGQLEIRFQDDCAGTIPVEELDLPFSPRTLDEDYFDQKDGLEVKLVNGDDQEVFPWDFLRAKIDAEYRNRQKQQQNNELKALGQRLKNFRKAEGLNQEELATRAGIGRVTLSRLERGKQEPRFQTLMDLASAMDISFQKLITEEESDFDQTAIA